MDMDRQNMPAAAPEPDIAARPKEIRTPPPAGAYESRGTRETEV